MSLLDDVSIVVTPNGYKAGELYAVIPVPTEGAEEVTNGDFATDSTWEKAPSGVTISGGSANFNSSTDTYVYQDILTATKTYKIIFSGTINSGSLYIGENGVATNVYTAGTYTNEVAYFKVASSVRFIIRKTGAGTLDATIDNISVKEYTSADMDVTRATDATRVDENGLIADVLSNVPRIDYTGGGCPHILAEPMRTNIVFPSDVAVTQTRTVTAVEYALSFYGTGSIVLSGTHSATLTGTGVNDRVDLIFTPTAGSLVLTVSGTVTNFQLEVGSYATSLIPTVSGTVTRNQDIFTRDGIGSLINDSEGTLYFEGSALENGSSSHRFISLSDGTSNNAIYIRVDSTASRFRGLAKGSAGAVTIITANGFPQTDNNKIALVWDATNFRIWINGSERATTTINDVPVGMNTLSLTDPTGSSPFFGKVKQLQVYNTALTDTQLAALTS